MDTVQRALEQWGKEWPELNTLPMGMMGRLMRISKILEARIADVHKQYGLKMGEFDVLATLRRSGKPYRLTPSALLDSMMLTSGAMTNRLDKLESKGLIVRHHSKADRRSVEVELSGQGLALIDEMVVEHVNTQNELVQGLTVSQQHQVDESLMLWLGALDKAE